MKKIFSFVLLSMMFSACSLESEKVGQEAGEVLLQVALPDWVGVPETRAGEGMLYPVNVLVVPEDADEATKQVTLTSGTDFILTLNDGTYDIWAVCGLPTEKIPTKLSDAVEIPNGDNGLTDFAAGRTRLTVTNGQATPEKLKITAARQLAWLDVEFEDVPKSMAEVKLYVKGLDDVFKLSNITEDGDTLIGWEYSEKGASRYTQIPLNKDEDNYVGGGLIAPCGDENGTTFVVEATTKNGNKKLLTYTSQAALVSGTHLTISFSYDWMEEFGGSFGIGDWDETSEDVTQEEPFSFKIGQQYFSQPATVINISSDKKALNILAHKPMPVTLAEMHSFDFQFLPYTSLPEIKVLRWAFPSSKTSMQNIVYTISQIGRDAFDEQFTSNGLTPIDREASNILAYFEKTEDKFYTYNFLSGEFFPVEDESGEFLVYPIGVIHLAE